MYRRKPFRVYILLRSFFGLQCFSFSFKGLSSFILQVDRCCFLQTRPNFPIVLLRDLCYHLYLHISTTRTDCPSQPMRSRMNYTNQCLRDTGSADFAMRYTCNHGVIHLVRIRTRGGGLTLLGFLRQKVPFYMYFVTFFVAFSYARRIGVKS